MDSNNAVKHIEKDRLVCKVYAVPG